MMLRNFTSKALLDSMRLSEKFAGEVKPEYASFSFTSPSFTGVTAVIGTTAAGYSGIIYDYNRVVSELYDPNFLTGFANAHYNTRTVQSTAIELTEPKNYEISKFMPVSGNLEYTFINLTLFDIDVIFEFNVINAQISFLQDYYKKIFKIYAGMLNDIVIQRSAK